MFAEGERECRITEEEETNVSPKKGLHQQTRNLESPQTTEAEGSSIAGNKVTASTVSMVCCMDQCVACMGGVLDQCVACCVP